ENQQSRVREKRLGQSQSRAHTVGIRADLRILAALQAYPLYDFLNSLFGRVSGIGAQDFEVTKAAQVIVKGRCLEDRAHLSQRLAPVRGDFETANLDLSSRGPDLTEHHADCRALSCAVVPEQTEDLPFRHFERKIIHDQPLAEELPHVSQF